MKGGNLNCRDPNPPSMKKQYLSKRKERRGRERRRRASKFTRERLFVRSRARMGNQSTSKTSVPLSLSGAPIGMNPPPRAPPQFNLLQNNFVDSARDLGKKLPRDPLSSSLRLPKRPSSRPLLMPRNRSGHIPPPSPPPLW